MNIDAGTKARSCVESLAAIPNLDSPDLLLLQKAVCHAYDENWGAAKDDLAIGLDSMGHTLKKKSEWHWLHASAVLIHIGYGERLVEFLVELDDHRRMRPWYEALRAAQLGYRSVLQSIAPEVRSLAEKFYDVIQNGMDGLPQSTRRWSGPEPVKGHRGRRKGRRDGAVGSAP